MTKEEAMVLRPIRNDDDHARALGAVNVLWGSPLGTQEGDALDMLVDLIVAYEEVHHAIPPPSLGGMIEARIEDGGVPRAAFERVLGDSATLDGVIAGTVDPTLAQARVLVEELGIPADCILIRRSERPLVA